MEILPTAWVVPQRLARGEFQFAVMPWTRVAAASAHGEDLVLVCGSGCEEAAIVVRQGLALEDVQTLAFPVLRHRLVVNFAAQSDGVSADKIIDRLIASTPTKEDELTSDARFKKIFAS